MPTTLRTAAEGYFRAKALRAGPATSTSRPSGSGRSGAPAGRSSSCDGRTSANFSTGSTTARSRTRGRTPAARPTRLASSCVPCWRGPGSRSSSNRRRGSPGRGTSATSPADTTWPRPRSTPSTSQPTRWKAAGVGCPSSDRPLLAGCPRRVLQLRRRHRDRLEVHAGPRTDPLAHVIWDRQSPDREAKERSPWGWLFYRRVKTDKAFYRPMNRVVHAHLRSILPEGPDPSARLPWRRRTAERPVPGAVRPRRHQAEAGHRDRQGGALGVEGPAEDVATYYDEHVPESSVEILGHSVGGITYRHYAHRAPLAFRAIMTLPQPTAFSAILRGRDSECPCCRRRFADAG